jgi:hypothetical protein
MSFRELPRFFDVLGRENLPREVCFDDILQPGHFRAIEKTAARANV